MEWILINTYAQPTDAHIDVLLLEAEEITYRLDDAQTIHIDPLMSQAIGGVKLFVSGEDAVRAAEIIRKNYEERKQAHPDEYIQPHDTNWTRIIVMILLGIFLLTLVVLLIMGGGKVE